MKVNVGPVDQLTRILFGLALLSLLFQTSDPFWWIGFIGLIPLLSGITRYCPLYSLLGVSSCPLPRQK